MHKILPSVDGAEELSDDTKVRVMTLVHRSMPNPYRPRLSEEREARLKDVEDRTAACYAGAEEIAFRLRRIAKYLVTEE